MTGGVERAFIRGIVYSPDKPSGILDPEPESLEGNATPESEGEFLPLKEIAELTGYSAVRLKALMKEGRVIGEMKRVRGVGRGGRITLGRVKWYTTVEAVEKYSREERYRRR